MFSSHITFAMVCPAGAAARPSLHHQGQEEQIGLVFTLRTAVHILYYTYSILIVFVYINLFSLFCIFENKFKM